MLKKGFSGTLVLLGGFMLVFVMMGCGTITFTTGTPSTPSVTVTPARSDPARGPGGGIVFYESAEGFDVGGVICHFLEAAPADIEGLFFWGGAGFDLRMIEGATKTGIGGGKSNTNLVVAANPNNTAARACADYRGGGLNDWYLPSKDELDLLNVNQGKIGNFKNDNKNAYSEVRYWSSTQRNNNGVWAQNFATGSQETQFLRGTLNVRPIRAY